MLEVVTALRRRRFLSLGLADVSVWFICYSVTAVARYVLAGTAVEVIDWRNVLVAAAVGAALYMALGALIRLHHGRSATGSAEELLSLSGVAALVGVVTTTVNFFGDRLVPATVPPGATLLAMVVMVWYRATYRAWRERDFQWRPGGGSGHGRGCAIVMGAGEAGQQLVRSMLRDPKGEWLPVAVLDDDRALRYRRVSGLRVSGGHEDIPEVARKTGATTLIIAIPSAGSEEVRELTDKAIEAGLDVKVLPRADQLLDAGSVAVADLRDIDVTDLLGRHQIDTDIAAIAGYLAGKRVLVTGAGGSIGSELCRQIAQFEPAELIMLDRDESALHAVQLSIYGRAMLDTDDVVLGDIRDSLFIDALFEQRKPHVVFHAAALKHLPMLEQYPGEAIKTNVWGTLTILEAARAHQAERFVNISTDKAANPASVLGYSKRLAEALTAAVAQDASGSFLSVRFGNVLGSRGSVLTAFASQIENGGPVTVTHPEVTRYFMTVQEAVQLVIQAAAIGRDGEALVLDMGEPVSIDSVARQLIELSGKQIEVVYTGLRHGEKMHEELLGDGEVDARPVHPLVSHTPVPQFAPIVARELDPWAEREAVVRSFKESVVALAQALAPPPEPRDLPLRGALGRSQESGLASR